MKFMMRVKEQGASDEEAWDEPYEGESQTIHFQRTSYSTTTIEECEVYAKACLESFNASIGHRQYRHDKERVLVEVFEVEEADDD